MEDKQKIVKVDIDGVIRDIIFTMCSLYNRETNEFFTEGDIKDYDVEKTFVGVYDPKSFFFTGRNAEEVFMHSLPYAHSRGALQSLREAGYKVVLVTWQMGVANKKYALDWLEKWSVPYDDICFTRDKYMIEGDYLIDDNPEFLLDERDKSIKIRIEHTYNEYMKDKVAHYPNIQSAVWAILHTSI